MNVLWITNMFPRTGHVTSGTYIKEQLDSIKAVDPSINIDLWIIEGQKSKINYFKALLECRRKVAAKKYDLIHAHYGFCGVVACAQDKVPVIVTYHGSDINVPWQRRISNLVTNRIAKKILVSPQMAPFTKGGNSVVIPCGVDFQTFYPMDRDEARGILGVGTSKKILLFPSNPKRPEKRFDLFMEVFHKVKEEIPNLDYLVLDKIPHEKVPLMMNASDALILTSSREGSPVVTKEAAACNLPIISVNVGDVRSLVEGMENCYICPADSDELARATVECLKANSSRSNGREMAGHLELKQVAKQIIALYKELI